MEQVLKVVPPLRRHAAHTLLIALLFGLGLFSTPAFARQAQTQAQAATAPQTTGIDASWQGTLHVPGHDLRVVVKITKSSSGDLTGQFNSIDQGGGGPISTVSFTGGVLRFGITGPDIKYEGKMSADNNAITGTFTQGGNNLPLNFERATPANAWEIPKPPAPIPPMAADANPSFDVVTIKPTKPDQQGQGFRVQGRHFTTLNTSVIEMMAFAYGIHPKQIINAPAWMSTDKFDIEGTPDAEGAPSDRQWKGMLQKMIVDRFQLKFTQETREMPAFVLTVAKGGPKLEKSQGDPNGLPGLFFSQLGNLHVNNANMEDFAHLMQQAVLDRPVVDHTDLKGRYNWNLKWTPDDSQFAGAPKNAPKPTDTADPPPPLFTAIQEQIGLKLDSTKTSVPVFVIDHAEKPSEN